MQFLPFGFWKWLLFVLGICTVLAFVVPIPQKTLPPESVHYCLDGNTCPPEHTGQEKGENLLLRIREGRGSLPRLGS